MPVNSLSPRSFTNTLSLRESLIRSNGSCIPVTEASMFVGYLVGKGNGLRIKNSLEVGFRDLVHVPCFFEAPLERPPSTRL